jgi:transcriptional regulator GlxA family with amidase domain
MTDPQRRVCIVLFDGQLGVEFIGPQRGPVASSQGVEVFAPVGYAEAGPADIVLVPGGNGVRRLIDDRDFASWLQAWAASAKIVTSVCTGSALLARAGLLDGYRATSNKASFDWVRQQSGSVDWVAQARWVEDRDRWTSSGVAAGMDMAAALLETLFGPEATTTATKAAELEVHTDASWDPFAELYGLTGSG